MDQFGRAQALEQAERESILRRHRERIKAQDKPALSHCEDCGDAIPEGRRLAIRGIRRCVGCQQDHENQEKWRG